MSLTINTYNNIKEMVNTVTESTVHSMSSPTNSPSQWIANKVRATGGRMATVVKALNFDVLGVTNDDFELEVAFSSGGAPTAWAPWSSTPLSPRRRGPRRWPSTGSSRCPRC